MAGLVADYGSESESESDSDSDELNGATASGNASAALPKPSLGLPKPDFQPGSTETLRDRSVFLNPFVEADNAKIAILEKHVKMISTDVKTVNGKKICWNYRKNKCRFGHNCKYAHDSDLQIDPATINASETKVQQIDTKKFSVDEESSYQPVRGKKRPGLSQSVTPGKKVMKSYNQQKRKNQKT